MFEFIGKYFWVIAIALTLLNYRWKTAHLARESDGTVVYRRALGFSITPWLVMGLGIVCGGTGGAWNYLRPQDLNPYVWAWYLCMFMLACGSAYWVFFRGGARRAAELQLVRVLSFGTPMQMTDEWIKISAAIRPAFIIFWIWLAWHLNASPPAHIP